MAWSSAELSQDLQDRMSANLPLILYHNVLTESSSAFWSNTLIGSDRTENISPAQHAYDGQTGTKTRASSTSTTLNNFVIEFPSPGVSFDCAILVMRPVSLISGGDTTVALEIADSPNFATNLQTIGLNFSVFTHLDYVSNKDPFYVGDFYLKHTGSDPLEYSGVQYARIKISPTLGVQPEIYQLWLGKRWALPHAPLVSYNSYNYNGGVERFVSDSGVVTSYVTHVPKFGFEGRWVIDDDEATDEFNHNLRKMAHHTGYGSKPFIWVECPQWSGLALGGFPSDAHMRMIYPTPGLLMQNTGASVHEVVISGTEQGGNSILESNPFKYRLES